MKFLALTSVQLQQFEKLKTTEEMQAHGPLKAYKRVPMHQHDQPALYVVSMGAAVCQTGNINQDEILAHGRELNAVLVESEDRHGWLSLIPGTLIEHVFGRAAINEVFA